MKISKQQLQKLIKEAVQREIKENFDQSSFEMELLTGVIGKMIEDVGYHSYRPDDWKETLAELDDEQLQKVLIRVNRILNELERIDGMVYYHH